MPKDKNYNSEYLELCNIRQMLISELMENDDKESICVNRITPTEIFNTEIKLGQSSRRIWFERRTH